jgi:O-antigen ligase
VAAYRSSSAMQFGDDPSLGHRLLSYAVALEQILAHPFIGNGHGATITYPMLIYGKMTVVTTSHIDSLYVVLLHRLGLAGLLLFGWVSLRALRRAYRIFQDSPSPETRIFCAGFAATAVNALVSGLGDAAMFVGRFAFVFAILFGLLAVLDREERAAASRSADRPDFPLA